MKKNTLTVVFWCSLLLASVFILWGIFLPRNVETVLGAVDGFVASNLGWVYILATTGFVLLALFLIFGPFGKITLGKPGENRNTVILLGLLFCSLLAWVSDLCSSG